MNLFNYTINQAKNEDIEKHLLQCSKLFSPALDTYVSIPDYSKKIRENAVTVEAWHSDELIGLVACYLNNDRTHEGYITNVSVIHDYQGKGVAKKLIKNTIEEALNKKFKTLNLEVEVNNKWAIELYRRSGFVLNGRLGSKYLMINRLLENKDVFISICCVTYNHVKYIRDTIESFLMQKTDFPIEILIHDDASTDGTADIIREYEEKHPDIIKPILQKENQYSKGRTISATYQFPRAIGNYIAICEGDDYWTDPYKLQKQVDFLENNQEYAMVAGDIDLVDINGYRIDANVMLSEQRQRHTGQPNFFNLIEINLINTVTVCVRSQILKELSVEVIKSKLWYFIDYWLWLNIAIKHKIFISKEIFAGYRVYNNSLSRSSGFLELRVPWIRFDAARRFVDYTRKVTCKEKVLISNIMLGLINNNKKSMKLKFMASWWLIKHPVYLFLWIRSKTGERNNNGC